MSYTENLPVIHMTGHQNEIYPWIQNDLETPFWRCYWNPSSGGFLKTSRQIIEMSPEHVYIIPGYTRFSTFAEKPFEQYYIHFTPPEKYFADITDIISVPATDGIKEYCHEWLALEKTLKKDFFRRELLAAAVLAEALLALPKELMQSKNELSAKIRVAVKMIEKNISSPPSNRELADACKMELRTFLRRFKQETAESPQQFSRRIRTEKASELLSYTDMSIEEIAEKTGFPDRYYFSRVFYQLQDMPPASFRRLQKKQIYRKRKKKIPLPE